MANADEKIRQLGIDLPTKLGPGRGVAAARRVGDLLFVSGHGPEDNEGNLLYRGQVGGEVSLDEAYQAARATGIQLLRSIKDAVGSLDRVDFVVKALGFVNSAPGFFEQPAVMHGFSDLMTEVFGQNGVHARSAIGTSSLPMNQPVEIELVVALRH